MVKKITLLFSGALFALSLIIPPNIGKLYILEYSDIPIIFLFLILLFSNFKKFKLEKNDYLWFGLIFIFVLFLIFDWFNPTSLRFIFYLLIGLLVKKIYSSLSIDDLESFVTNDGSVIYTVGSYNNLDEAIKITPLNTYPNPFSWDNNIKQEAIKIWQKINK